VYWPAGTRRRPIIKTKGALKLNSSVDRAAEIPAASPNRHPRRARASIRITSSKASWNCGHLRAYLALAECNLVADSGSRLPPGRLGLKTPKVAHDGRPMR
jgi:hypothetical protein